MTEGKIAMFRSREVPANTFNGYLFLLLWLVLLAVSVWSFLSFGGSVEAGRPQFGWLSGMVGGPILFLFTLFGEYKGTERTQGLRWIWPWMGKKKLSVRAHNIHSERIKINDKRGNPIDVACNVVWRVNDTAQAVFDVDDYKAFVNIQIEAGLRTVGARHPYDDFEEEETTLRGSPDIVNHELREELNERLHVAGLEVDEAGLTHLAYASEIAGAMLRRQQAEAVIAARAKVVMGAVSMVQMALDKLSEDNIVHLDDERRAAMVSNLMVVLCGERDVNPVVNAGTLYQ